MPAFLDGTRPDVPDIVVPRGITPFHLPGRPVRGRLVRLGPLADALLTRHDNHPAVTRLAGEALALAAALATALKFQGSFSLQAKGDGPVPMLLADCTQAGALRGYARAEPEKLAAALAAADEPTAAEPARAGLPGVHGGPGTGPGAAPGHRRDRGRRAGRHGAALLRDQRAVAMRPAPGLRQDGGRVAGVRPDPGAGRGGRRHRRPRAGGRGRGLAGSDDPGGDRDRTPSCWTTGCRQTS